MTIRPLRDRILVERIEGHGIETISPGGIILPATREAKVKTKADTFRAMVLALGPDTGPLELSVGDEVLVYTYADDDKLGSGSHNKLWTGEHVEGVGTFIRPDDIVCAYGQAPSERYADEHGPITERGAHAEPDPFPQGNPYRRSA
jgi:co-chaperonin GroES (HSP10)